MKYFSIKISTKTLNKVRVLIIILDASVDVTILRIKNSTRLSYSLTSCALEKFTFQKYDY